MAEPQEPPNSDPTFRSYTSSQAADYANSRLSYSAALYDTILSYHSSTSGKFGTLLDVGCGPGNATRDLASSFYHAIGIDPGEELMRAAREKGGKTLNGGEIKFYVSGAEELEKVEALKEGSVDLLISAMAAHWFDMAKFWTIAAKIVKLDGTVAIWTCSSFYCHPVTPNAAAVQAILSNLEDNILAPFSNPGIDLTRHMYDQLPLPWTLSPPMASFPSSRYIRHEWDRNGHLSNGQDFFGGSDESTLAEIKKGLGTASMVTRWREAYSESVGMEKDCVKVTVEEIRRAMGMEGKLLEECKLRTGSSTALLLFKRQ